MRTRAKPWLLENLRFAYYFLGVVYLALGLVMLGLEGLALLLRESPWGFLTGAVVGLGLGGWFRKLGDPRHEPGRAEAPLSIALLWLLVPALGAIPFWLLVVGAIVRRELICSLHPQAVITLRLGSKALGEDVMRSVAAFVTLYVVLLAAGTLIISLLENNFVVGFTASAQAIGNIGPGLGEVGPMGSYAGLEPLPKAILIFQMWAGRIELIPVFSLFTPEPWKKMRG